MSHESCLVSRLERFIKLTEQEKAFVSFMEKDERHMDAGSTIVKIGEPVEHRHRRRAGPVAQAQGGVLQQAAYHLSSGFSVRCTAARLSAPPTSSRLPTRVW